MCAREKEGYAYHAELTKGALATVLREKDRFDLEDAWAVVRRVDCADVVPFHSAEAERFLEQWTGGQVFNTSAELRWRRVGDGYAVLLLAEEDNPPADFQPLQEKDKPFTVGHTSSDEGHGFLLWGTRYDQGTDTFWEARVPRPLCYPLKTKGKPPRLAYRLYREGEVVRWVRLVNLVEEK